MKYLSNALCAMANASKNKPLECPMLFFDEPECPKEIIEK